MGELPVGRRVAYWRARRRLSQQVFADRLGKSKSWVDKVERGVRALDKLSTLQAIATVLRIDTAILLGRDTRPVEVATRADELERVRAALSRYEIPFGRPPGARPVLPADRMARQVAHAWTTFQYARYPHLVGLLPGLLADAHHCHAADPVGGRVPLVQAYRVTAAVLVKLGDPDLGWLAVDRAMNVASGDRYLVAAAAVQLGQVLRAAGRARVAKSAMLAAAYRIAPAEHGDGPQLSLCGTLLVQAALAAARDGDDSAVADLLDEAGAMAAQVGDGLDHQYTGFGPTAVTLARAAAAVDLGDVGQAIAWHQSGVRRDGWRWLPAEHRAAHLVDTARAHLHATDPRTAGRILTEADRIAPAEVRRRPAGRDLLARIAHDPDAPATITHLATCLGVG
ncbi:helix-turn-helix domain-containing protein [Micromonospora yangpuensis]|uniref:Transcriptional regulator, contains XRE-family HTH domain n=1 Tax=Micromonospora yangpuensis TaxID=683228 RepID=A0A1C6U0A9_9ACTN|nr:helix-turn-helix domain-containing protein [Micromonospora yangpuensis]GGM21623.1 transcriptional regulator [Micromonospora yangpuensis]SCL47338.1 Transcriptional regulator, contains XRE-family HTH domain [Micromonospora yangpuensis]